MPSSNFTEYVVLEHPAHKERIFQEAKKKFGSRFMFHGSGINNWYSIVRNGLRNLSNTGMMTAGAAYGAGIYSARDYGTASGYAGRRHYPQTPGVQVSRWTHSICANVSIVGVIEIIAKPEYSRTGFHGKYSSQTDFGIAVVPEDNHVML